MQLKYNLHNDYAKLGSEIYKRVDCGFKYDNLVCDISADSLQDIIIIQFIKDALVYMRLVLPRELLQSIEFKYVVQFLENNYNTEVSSVLSNLTLTSMQAKNIFEAYSKIEGLTLDQTIDACLMHIDLLYIDSDKIQGLKRAVSRIKTDYV